MLRVTGEIVRIENKPWNMEGRAGITQKARVLVGKADFVDVVYPEGLRLPAEGTKVDVAVIASAPSGRLKIQVQGDWAAMFPTLAQVKAS
jgi:hypothetical protein